MTTRTVVPIHTTLAAKARGVARAAYLAAEHTGCATRDACRISARAVERYRNGECSPAMAVARATAEARNLAHTGAA